MILGKVVTVTVRDHLWIFKMITIRDSGVDYNIVLVGFIIVWRLDGGKVVVLNLLAIF